NRFPQLRKTKSAPLYETPMKTGFDIRPAWQVARLVRFTNAQIIHAHTPRSILIGRVASMLTGVPLVFHVHSPTARDSSRPLQNLVNDRIERWCAKGAQRLICVSQSLADHMQNLGFDQQQVVVAANGVPRLPWCERDTPSGRWTLGTVALIRPRKGIETLLRAIAKMREKGNDVVLNAVGPFETESYESEVKSLTAELGLSDAVQWIGMTRDVNAELAKMDLFALPSLYGEGMPMVVLEAMAAGLPVVATRVEGVPELVRDGIDGLLASPNSADELAACIGRFVRGEADWHRMRRAAFTRQSADFSDESMARLVASTYRQVLGDLAP
ncbi:MAG: glycosyltransferase, partial [Pirellulaceae bacterium]|nr:glycosyltransferase [Pirellulaceae bacterium]